LIIVVNISGLFAFYQEFKSNKIMESFQKMVPRRAHVFRNSGERQEVAAEELVVGDIVELKSGDLIPADVRIICSQNFKVDNSSLTGESEAQTRTSECTNSDPMETKNLAFFSTNAIEGNATGLVVRVGSKTLIGKLSALSSSMDSRQSPIGIEMDRFILIMTIRSFVIGVIFFGIAILMGYRWLDAIFFIIGIMVANIPEGLSVTFTMILSLTAKRMAGKNCLVKHLQAVEALGSTSVICSDKVQNNLAI
jgi:sodium/potassium-transporting ATPase subunit alpha